MILVVAEQRDGTLNRATWETIAAAQQLCYRGIEELKARLRELGADQIED